MKTTEILLFVIPTVLLLSACGQKGPLYLPEEQAAVSPQETDANSEDDDKDKEEQSSASE